MSVAAMMRVETTQTHKKEVKRGQIWIARLEGKGSVQNGVRPVLVISNNLGNRHSPTVTIVPITSSNTKKEKALPTHVRLDASKAGLQCDSIAMFEQIQTVPKEQMLNYVSTVYDSNIIYDIDVALRIQVSIQEDTSILGTYTTEEALFLKKCLSNFRNQRCTVYA